MSVLEGSSNNKCYFFSCEVESREAHACGERTAFQGRELTICGRTCESRKGELIFTYRLARPEWASQRRLSNEKLSGLSLLGTVLFGEEETLRLKLDIDRDHPDQNQGNEYPFPWRPATGNLMYLMPSKGSRVSLYFKNGDESSATAVNCIRQEGEGAENEYRKRSLWTEHQKELKLYPDRMGVVSPDAHVLLDDLKGLSVRGRKSLKILSVGKVSVSGQTVTLSTGKGKLSVYHGHAEAEKDGTVVFVKDAEFHHKEEGTKADSLGDRTCLCAYEKEDYSGNEYRFRDDPVEENYDCTGLVVQVMGGLVIMGGVTLASGIVATAVGAGASATMVMGATAVGGTTFVAGLAATDFISRRVSSMEEYMKTALAGSVVGALTGAAELVPVSGLARVGVDFLAGASGSAAGQLITEGEVDAERMFQEGVLAAVMVAGARRLRGGDEKLFDYADERLEDIPSSVWNDGQFSRGNRIDEAEAIRNNLCHNFPMVDRLYGKVLSSNKSYDTTRPSYLDAKNWLNKMKQDINKLNKFTEKRWVKIRINQTSYDIKRLNIVLPNVELTREQKTALEGLKAYAESLKIEVKVYITK